MANLLGQNIGTNYKGILNLNTLNGNLSGTLQAVTDGDGNASPLQLSTTFARIQSPTAGDSYLYIKGATTSLENQGVVFTPNNSDTIYGGITGDFSSGVIKVGGFRTGGYYTAIFADNAEVARFRAGNLGVGGVSGDPSARLQVKGDGTNPIARFEDDTNSPMLRIENSVMRFGASTPFGCLQFAMTGTTISGNNNGLGLGFYSQNGLAGTSDRFDFGFGGDAVANTAGTASHLALVRNFAAGAGSANFRPLNLAYTINNSGAQTGTATGILLNATETALNGMTHNLLDLQVGGVSKLSVKNTGQLILDPTFGLKFGASSTNITAPSNGNLTLLDNAGTSFNRLQFGGTTNAFPAIKRNSAGIDFRLADDSGYATIRAFYGVFDLVYNSTFSIGFAGGTTGIFLSNVGSTIFSATGATSVNASAQVQIDSTTKGFLPPRMTTTERDLIATPAAGLMIYNTTTNRPNFYDGSAWVAL
jgi:hypothetical protein